MNIGFDGRALVGARTGVGIWTEQVAGGLARAGAGRVFVAATKTITLEPQEAHNRLGVVAPPRWPTLGPVWLNTTVPRIVCQLEFDVWIGSLAILPSRIPVPGVAMVHDLTPRTHPELHTVANRLVFRFLLERSLRTARVVVAGSEATSGEILSAYPWVEPKLVRIGYGVDEWFSPFRMVAAAFGRANASQGTGDMCSTLGPSSPGRESSIWWRLGSDSTRADEMRPIW